MTIREYFFILLSTVFYFPDSYLAKKFSGFFSQDMLRSRKNGLSPLLVMIFCGGPLTGSHKNMITSRLQWTNSTFRLGSINTCCSSAENYPTFVFCKLPGSINAKQSSSFLAIDCSVSAWIYRYISPLSLPAGSTILRTLIFLFPHRLISQ
jgi:hypothetical protein